MHTLAREIKRQMETHHAKVVKTMQADLSDVTMGRHPWVPTGGHPQVKNCPLIEALKVKVNNITTVPEATHILNLSSTSTMET
jgi:hypothetical protein